jgi:hypothetical protein
VGRWNVGALAVRQDGLAGADAGSAFVGRVSANVLDESSVGAIVTAGDPNSSRGNSVVGADFRYLNTRVAGGRVLEGDAWFQRSQTDGVEGDSSAFGAGIRMPNNSGWRGGLGLKAVEANFNPALGFVSRAGVRDVTADAGYTHFVGGGFLQSLFSGVDAERITFLDGGLQSQAVLGRLIEIQSNSGEEFGAQYSATREVVTRPFTIFGDETRQVVVPIGSYTFGERVLNVQTAGQRTLAGSLTYRAGDFYSGTRENVVGNLTWRQSRTFSLSARYDWNSIHLPQGSFITRLMRLTTEVNFSSTVYWVNLIQYDNVSEVIGVNARLQWIPRAGQEGLIVLNHSLADRDRDNRFRSDVRNLTVKFSYTFRL